MLKRFDKKILLLVIVAGCFALPALRREKRPKILSSDEKIIFSDDFDGHRFSSLWRVEKSARHSVKLVHEPHRTGKHAVRFELRREDELVHKSKRVEIKLPSVPSASQRWYSFSIYLPSDFIEDNEWEILAQWHDKPDGNKRPGGFETWRKPALCLSSINGHWRLYRRWDPAPITVDQKVGPDGGTEEIDLGPYQTDTWTDWVFHIKWSWQEDGLLEIWKNGEQVLNHTGPNTYNDLIGPYFKMGVYKPPWVSGRGKPEITRRVVYFDRVRIGGSKATYEDIAP